MPIDVELEGFSGPLDLLCHLVESREIEAASISVSELVRAYAVFLQDSQGIPINTLAEFMALAARLLVGKLKALFPVPSVDEDDPPIFDMDIDEEDIMSLLKRYRPYRKAAQVLADFQRRRERHFCRSPEEGPSFFDLGDLYSLSAFWWRLTAVPLQQAQVTDETSWEEEAFVEGIPDTIPEGVQVECRMDDLRKQLSSGESMSLRELVGPLVSKQRLIVTLLALLELSRLGEVNIRQKEVLGNVFIEIAPSPVSA